MQQRQAKIYTPSWTVTTTTVRTAHNKPGMNNLTRKNRATQTNGEKKADHTTESQKNIDNLMPHGTTNNHNGNKRNTTAPVPKLVTRKKDPQETPNNTPPLEQILKRSTTRVPPKQAPTRTSTRPSKPRRSLSWSRPSVTRQRSRDQPTSQPPGTKLPQILPQR